jgi:tRNA1(Val) A37 N6-methylase TrmN6
MEAEAGNQDQQQRDDQQQQEQQDNGRVSNEVSIVEELRHVLEDRDYFKGWAVPGPRGLPGPELMASGQLTMDRQRETLDALSGRYRIFQLKRGHRFSTDDVLTAWYGTMWVPSAQRVLDLGSGLGSVAMTAAWRLPRAEFVTVEAQEESLELAKKSVMFNGLGGRFDVRRGDFREEGVLGKSERFDLVMGSPPYFPVTDGMVSEVAQRKQCRFETRGGVEDYCKVASEHLALGGWFACCFPVSPPHQKQRVWEGARQAGLQIIRWRPVVFREGEPPLLGLFAMVKEVDVPEYFRSQTWEEPALVIRTASGEIHPEYGAVKMSFGFRP